MAQITSREPLHSCAHPGIGEANSRTKPLDEGIQKLFDGFFTEGRKTPAHTAAYLYFAARILKDGEQNTEWGVARDSKGNDWSIVIYMGKPLDPTLRLCFSGKGFEPVRGPINSNGLPAV